VSLAEKFEEMLRTVYVGADFTPDEGREMKRLFYAGAEAWRDASENGELTTYLNAEIDHFRSQR
jgi:hypothetical protein